MSFKSILKPSNETYVFTLYKRIPNTYDYETAPKLTFKGRPTNNYENKLYRIKKGVNANEKSVFIMATNLPENVEELDKVVFMGKEMVVESTGYFLNDSGIVDASFMSSEYLESRSPKGLTLK